MSPIESSPNCESPATAFSELQTQSSKNSCRHRSDFAPSVNSVHSASSLKMALLNVRSLINKTFIVSDIISSHRLDCILLTETWLDETGKKELLETSPPNFSFSRCTRTSKKGGGVAAIYSDILSCKSIHLGSYSTFEYLALAIRSDYPCLLLTIYRPPRLKKGFLTEFSELLSQITVEYDYILILGDFNIHIDCDTDRFANHFTELLSSFELIQHITGATHNQGHTLDLVISKGLDITLECFLDVGISDHFCIFFNVAWKTRIIPGLKLVKRRTIAADLTVLLLNIPNSLGYLGHVLILTWILLCLPCLHVTPRSVTSVN